MTTGTEVKERRAATYNPFYGNYTYGIKRLEDAIRTRLLDHDKECSRAYGDNTIWQSGYSLLNHSFSLASIMVKIGQSLRRSEHHVVLGYIAALYHDIGKLHPSCHVYRANRKLTPEEKAAIDRHPEYSDKYLQESRSSVRVEDHLLLDEAHWLIRFHHKPWMILDPVLRKIAYNIKYADAFLSCTEDRHDPGLSSFNAVKDLHDFAAKELLDPIQKDYTLEVVTSYGVIERLYGLDLKRLSEM